MSSSRVTPANLRALPRAGKYGVILADPPWSYEAWSGSSVPSRVAEAHYKTMAAEKIANLPVRDLAGPNCVLLLWATWPTIEVAFRVIKAWGFTYKTCGFDWMKADVTQMDLFADSAVADMKLGYWTRSNSEPCLLATRGQPKRRDAGVRMGIIERAREHSRKPECVYDRIERLVAGPYVELFARQRRRGWDALGDQRSKFKAGR